MLLAFLFLINTCFSFCCMAMERKDPGLVRKGVNFLLKRWSPSYQEKYATDPEARQICQELKQKALQGIADSKISPALAEDLHRYNERCYYAGERLIALLAEGKADDIEKIYKEIDHDEISPLIKLYIVGFLTHSTLMLEEKASKRTAAITGQVSLEAIISQTREHQKRLLTKMAQDLKKDSDNFLAEMMINTGKLVDDRMGPASLPINISRHDSDENETPLSRSAPDNEKEIKNIQNDMLAAANISIAKAVNKK